MLNGRPLPTTSFPVRRDGTVGLSCVWYWMPWGWCLIFGAGPDDTILPGQL